MKELFVSGTCSHRVRSLATVVVLGPGSLWLNHVDNVSRVQDSPNVLSKIGALFGCGGFWTACLGGGCCYFLNGPYTIQLVSWGAFAWTLGIYVTLTWAKLWQQKRLDTSPVQSVQASAALPQPQSNSTPDLLYRELLAVERWLRVIIERNRDSHESSESDSEGEQIGCSVHEASKEEPTFTSSQQLDGVLLMRGQSANRRRKDRRARRGRPALS